MPRQVTAWQTSDGELFLTEEEALANEHTTDSLGVEADLTRYYLHPTEGLTKLSYKSYQKLEEEWGLPHWETLIICFNKCVIEHEASTVFSEHYIKENTYEQLHELE